MQININLLPKNKIKENEKKIIFQFIAVQLFLLLCIVLFVAAVFISSNQILAMMINDLTKINEDLISQKNYKEIYVYEDVFKKINSSVGLISTIQSGHLNWFNLFEELNAKVPVGVKLSGLSNKDFTIFISGVADSRENLLSFQSALEENNCLTDINLPFSYLVAKNDVNFQLDAKIKIECLKK